MTPAVSAITIVLAVVGAISSGVWSTLAVQYLVNRGKPTVEGKENQLLRDRLIELKTDYDALRDEANGLRTQLDEQQNTIMKKLLG